MSTPFANLYYKRLLQGHGAPPRHLKSNGLPHNLKHRHYGSYICSKPTTTVLSTQPVVDFIYACDTHLSDPGFATLQAPAASPTPSASAEEIAKVKAEWEAKQKKKQEQAEKEKEGEKDGEKKEGEKDKIVSPKPASPLPVASGSSTPRHDKYVLHRQ
ncbi:AAA-ATPase Vps4-associated protein [Rhizoctonia solani AG-3 Rhs1AP]|uniref:AAA-ATPase Vps4-associated protein n=2 Tax=Rhizoctonia solani AG-3 TaxID=1086053 RepID=A0A074S565_9AGAM|nr:AAA-ATPase Vps4-associated protein [Rhizoctonia solani AG-3 Rhs1AP]KEP52705.1 AAA-ATPase Vps4-associated protein [Rhizoctonia solani 123E]